MKNQTSYYPHLDALKGLAILLMVMGHVIPWTLNEAEFLHQPINQLTGVELYNSIVYKFIYAFHMPLLFFVSGFLFYKDTTYSIGHIKSILIKRTHRLLIPYFVTGTLLWIARGHWGYWFLQMLFFLNIYTALLLFFVNSAKNRIQEFSTYVIGFFILYAINKSFPNLETETQGVVVIARTNAYYPAFMLGILCKRYENFESFIRNEHIVFASLIIFILLFWINGTEIPMFGFIRAILLPLTMIIYLNHFFINKSCQSQNGGGILSLVGKNSLEVYLLHVFFTMQFKEIGEFMLSLASPFTCITFQIVYSFVLSVISIGLSIFTADFLKNSNILKRFMFGLCK